MLYEKVIILCKCKHSIIYLGLNSSVHLPALSSMCGVKGKAAAIRRPGGVQTRVQKGGSLLAGTVQPNCVQAISPAVPDSNFLLRPAVGDDQYVPFTVLVVAAVMEGCPCHCTTDGKCHPNSLVVTKCAKSGCEQ